MLYAAPDRRPLAIALACFAAGVLVVLLALSGSRSAADRRAATAPAIVASVATPAPAAYGVAADPLAQMRTSWRRLLERNERAHVPAAWVAGFYPIYERAQRAFGVNWLLLASVHRQETAFSSHPSTYHGLNFAGCCAGPMQFNVTNGPTTTWERYRGAFRQAVRPASYPNPTPRTLRSTTTSTRSWPEPSCWPPTAPRERSTAPPGRRPTPTTDTT